MASRILTRRLVTRPLTAMSKVRTSTSVLANQQRHATSQPTEEENEYPVMSEAEDPGMVRNHIPYNNLSDM